MTSAEYLAIFENEQLIRSPVVRLLEEQIRILFSLSNVFIKADERGLSNYCEKRAEEAKWEAICIAEYEQKHGLINLG